jgi:hypothetical protein
LTINIIIEAEVKESLISIMAICGIFNLFSKISNPYLMKNKAHKANALAHPKEIKVYISVDPNSI